MPAERPGHVIVMNATSLRRQIAGYGSYCQASGQLSLGEDCPNAGVVELPELSRTFAMPKVWGFFTATRAGLPGSKRCACTE